MFWIYSQFEIIQVIRSARGLRRLERNCTINFANLTDFRTFRSLAAKQFHGEDFAASQGKKIIEFRKLSLPLAKYPASVKRFPFRDQPEAKFSVFPVSRLLVLKINANWRNMKKRALI